MNLLKTKIMKLNNIKLIVIAMLVSFTAYNCSNDDDNSFTPMQQTLPDFSGTYVQEDQMGRPAINTVFVSSADKNTFNVTVIFDIIGQEFPTQEYSFLLEATR